MWSVWCMLCVTLCVRVYAHVHVFLVFFFSFDDGGAVDLPQRFLLFCFSHQFQARFHLLSDVNMWKRARNCCEKQKRRKRWRRSTAFL